MNNGNGQPHRVAPTRMVFNCEKYHRRSIRLKNFDYSYPCFYFITICSQKHFCLFGNVEKYEMKLNDAGIMVRHWWEEIKQKFSVVKLDEYTIMPNHLHGIIVLKPDGINDNGEYLPSGVSIPNIIEWFKTMSTNNYIRNIKQKGWERFEKRLWQRNYYEHIIRNDESLDTIRHYIRINPLYWLCDKYNADRNKITRDDLTRLLLEYGFTKEGIEKIKHIKM